MIESPPLSVRDRIHRMDGIDPLLKTSLGIMLHARQPVWIVWGAERSLFYNDACLNLLPPAERHSALGKAAPEVWGEAWSLYGPLVERTFQNAEVCVESGLRLEGAAPQTSYRFSTGAIHEESGRIRGVFCSCQPEKPRLGRLTGRKILLVDDAPEIQALIKTYLEGTGALIRTASDGVEGVEIARSERFDLTLMDIQMPRRDGVEATQILRQEGRRMPIVALSGQTKPEDQERCFQAGCTLYLPKPIDRQHLVETIQQLTGSKAL